MQDRGDGGVGSGRPALPGGGPAGGLPMYDLPGLEAANHALWSALGREAAARGVPLPASAPGAMRQPALLSAPDLALGQVCGLPFAKARPGSLRLVATPVYAAPGCVGAAYRSILIGRPGSRLAMAAAGVAAVNEAGSQSGHLALRRALAWVPCIRPGTTLVTGSHLASVRAVAAGRATIAAIDCVTFALLGDTQPDLIAGIGVIGVTPAAPALPLVTRGDMPEHDVAALFEAIVAIFADPALAAVRRQLRLVGVERLQPAAYDRFVRLEADAPPPLVGPGTDQGAA